MTENVRDNRKINPKVHNLNDRKQTQGSDE